MIKKIKNLVLHHLFSEWLENEKNVQNLVNIKLSIQNKQDELRGLTNLLLVSRWTLDSINNNNNKL